MSIAEVREKVPEFLRGTFDRNLPVIVERLVSVRAIATDVFAGRSDLLPQAIRVAHDLGGSLGVFGLMELSHKAQAIEKSFRNPDLFNEEWRDGILLTLRELETYLQG